MEIGIGKRNITFGWIWILAGLLVGALMGMWSFNGPMPSPVGDYASLGRRMLRLSHIAFIALAIINILYGYEIDRLKISKRLRSIGSRSMIYGAALIPLLLIGAVFFEPLKYLTTLPAVLVILAVSIIVYGRMK
jgi:cytochrome b561